MTMPAGESLGEFLQKNSTGSVAGRGRTRGDIDNVYSHTYTESIVLFLDGTPFVSFGALGAWH
jgi:hypothetical protein